MASVKRRTEKQAAQNRVERRKEKTRRLLIEGARGLFYEKGLHLTKVEDITERADVGKGTFYRYFETKEVLVQEILQEGFDILLSRLRDALQSTDCDNSMAQALIGAQVRFYLQHPDYLLLFHQVRGSLRMSALSEKALRGVYNGYLARLAEMVHPALPGAAGSAHTAQELAMALSAFTSGLLIDHLFFDKGGVHVRRKEIQTQLERSIQALI